MNNVQAPLDIGFFDSEGRLKKVLLMKPYTANERPLYDPGVPFQYALEAREGYFSDSGLTEGRSRLVVQSIKGRVINGSLCPDDRCVPERDVGN